MSLHLTAAGVTSTASGHAAHRDTNGTWHATWLSGQALTGELALAAVAAAELVATGVLNAGHQGWPLLNDFATALDLTADAVVYLIKGNS